MNDLLMSFPSITKLEQKVVAEAMKNGWSGKKKYYYVEILQII